VKVGILTWYYAMNYGARAHTDYLYNYLRSLGCEIEIIRYRSLKALYYELRCCFTRSVFRTINGLKFFFGFNTRKDAYDYSPLVFTSHGINRQHYDVVILGSDEIFNPIHPCYDEIYMGVGIKCKKLVTYAVSSGQVPLDKRISENAIRSLSSMRELSVRDSYSKMYLSQYYSASIREDIDPTLLSDSYSSDSPAINKGNYILIYSFGNLESEKREIIEYAKEKDYLIIKIGRASGSDCWEDEVHEYISQREWYNYFENAELVITDSFHGLIFAIKNQKNFVIVKKDDKLNKIYGLLEQLCIEKKFYDGNETLEKYIESGVDYSKYLNRIEKLRGISQGYLKEIVMETLVFGEE